MKKNFFKFLLLGAFTLSLGAGFVGCKDYDDDIDGLTDKVAALDAALNAAKTELAAKDVALQTAVDKAQADATAAKTAADAAAEKAALAQAAAAQAKLDAVAEAKAYVDGLLADLDPGMDEAAVNALIDTKLADVVGRVTAVEGDVTALQNQLKDIDLAQIAANQAKLNLQEAVLTAYDTALKNAGFTDASGNGDLAAALKAVTDMQGVLGTMTEDDLKALAELVEKVDPILNVLNTPLATLKSLGYIPELYVDGIETLLFPVIFDWTVMNLEGEIYPEPALTMPVFASFRVNPSNADVRNPLIEWGILNRQAAVSRAGGDGNDLFTIESQTFDNGETTVEISADMSKAAWTKRGPSLRDQFLEGVIDLSELPQADFLALKAVAPVSIDAPTGDTHEIVSDYVRALYMPYIAIIADSVGYWAEHPDGDENYWGFAYRPCFLGVPDIDQGTDPADHQIAFNGGPYDLTDYVTSAVGVPGGYFKWIEDYGIKNYEYEFEVVEGYFGEDDITDQAWFVSVDGNMLSIERGRSSIDRTPLIKVTLKVGGQALASHYIKFEIVEEVIDLTPIVVDAGDQGDLNYIDLYDNSFVNPVYVYEGYDLLTWEQINADIYDMIPMSHQEFLDNYETSAVTIDYDHVADAGSVLLADEGEATYEQNPENTSTYTLNVKVDPKTRFGEHAWTVVFTPTDAARYPEVHVKFEFNLVAPANPAFDPNYVVDDAEYGKMSTVKGIENAGTVEFQALMLESFLQTSVTEFRNDIVRIANPNMFFTYTHDTGYGEYEVSPASTNKGIVYAERAEETPVSDPLNGRINGPRNWNGSNITLTRPITIPEWHYKTSLIARYENNDVVATDWTYKFVNPLEVTLAAVTLKTEQAPATQELAKLLTVKVLGNSVYISGTENPTGAATRWSVPKIENMPWTIGYNAFTKASALYLSKDATGDPATTLGDYKYVYWENKGTSLANDVTTEKLSVTVATPYASLTKEINMTIKKTTSVPAGQPAVQP